MSEHRKTDANSIRPFLRTLEKQEEERKQLIGVQKQIKLATVMLVLSLVNLLPARSPAMRFHIVQHMVNVNKPAGKKAGNARPCRLVTMISKKTHSGGRDYMTDCAHLAPKYQLDEGWLINIYTPSEPWMTTLNPRHPAAATQMMHIYGNKLLRRKV